MILPPKSDETVSKHDIWLLITLLVSIVSFILALFFKGLTQDILLELGVLTVSVKIILSSTAILQKISGVEKKIDALTVKDRPSDQNTEK